MSRGKGRPRRRTVVALLVLVVVALAVVGAALLLARSSWADALRLGRGGGGGPSGRGHIELPGDVLGARGGGQGLGQGLGLGRAASGEGHAPEFQWAELIGVLLRLVAGAVLGWAVAFGIRHLRRRQRKGHLPTAA